MIDLRIILSELYADRSYEQMELFLQNYRLLEPLKKTVSQLNTIITNQTELKKQFTVLPVGHIASNLLFTINDTIAGEKDIEQKKVLETTLSSLCLQILKSFFGHIKVDKAELVLQIDYAFRDTCAFFNYDYSQLNQFFNLRSLHAYHNSIKHGEVYKTIVSEDIPCYTWHGKEIKKAEFIQLLKEQELAESKKGLFHLFGSPKEKLGIQLNPKNADLTLQLFHTLKSKKLLSYTGCNGFYQVLEYHVLDFKELFLKNKSPRERINALKQSRTKWKHHQEFVDAWLKGFLDN